ncbi:phage tail tape measure protein [Fusibacter sp. JL298sf-3]
MEEVGSLVVKLAMENSGFDKGIQNANRKMALAKSEFQKAAQGVRAYGTDLDKLRAKKDYLAKAVEASSEKVSLHKERLSAAKKALDNNATAQEKLREKLDSVKSAYENSVKALGQEHEETERLKREKEALSKEYSKGEQKIRSSVKATQNSEVALNKAEASLAKVKSELGAVSREIETQSSRWTAFGKKMEAAGQKMDAVGTGMQNVGRTMTTRVTLPIVGVGVAATKIGLDFEAAMSEVSAVSGATGEDFKRLESVAKELGSSTKYSASEAAEGLNYMALAGWDTNQMVSGLPGVLDLAAASNMNLGTAADIVTDTMSAFGLEATKAGNTADVFARASSKSNTNVAMLGEAMKYAGSAAKSSNMDLEETTTVLGILADSGIKGSMAGTTFTAMLNDMKKSAKDGSISIGETQIALYDATGAMRDMTDITKELESATASMSGEQRDAALSAVFGQQSLKGVNILLETGTKRYDELESSIRNSSGAAKEMAAIMQENTKGSLTELKSQLEGVAIQIYEVLAPHLQKLVESLKKGVEWFSKLDSGTQSTIVKMAALAAAVGPVLSVGGKLVSTGASVAKGVGAIGKAFGVAKTATTAGSVAMGGAAKAVGGLAAAKGALGAAATVLTGPVGLAVAGVAAVGVAAYATAKHLKKDAIPAVDLFGKGISETTEASVGKFMTLNDEATVAINQLSWGMQTVTEDMAMKVSGNFDAMSAQILTSLEVKNQESLQKCRVLFHSLWDFQNKKKQKSFQK